MKIKVYRVGGSVRDDIMGLPVKDYDFAIEAPSFEAMKNHILGLGGEIFLEHEKYFTIRAKVPNLGAADFVLCRKDGIYKDGRRPESVEVAGLEEELKRRDFTVNAIAIDSDTGEYIDPFDGRKDIEKKLIRCVGNPYDRFNEDALRIIRAIRFSITKGMIIETNTKEHMFNPDIVSLLKNISLDRVRDELERCFRFSTLDTLARLNEFYMVRDVVFDNNKLWLEPTMKYCR